MGFHHHDHGDGHHHHHGKKANRKALLTSLIIITAFLVVEVVGGLLTNSLALLSDAGHMLSDSSALFLSLIAMYFAAKKPSPQKTYGFHRFEILAALTNGVTLVLISLYIFWEAYQRLSDPPEVASLSMMAIAFVGLLANMAAAYVLMRGDYKHNLNLRSAFLHVLGDMLGSVGAIAAGFVMWRFEWYLADPIISIVVGALVLLSAWRVTKESVNVLMEGTPVNIDAHHVSQSLASIPGVISVHDLHIWTVTSGFDSLTCHLHVEDDLPSYPILREALYRLDKNFGITHATIQIENSAIHHRELMCEVGPRHDHKHDHHHDHDHDHDHEHH
jgi:cobalt-zinc-cadmium efflux system protein